MMSSLVVLVKSSFAKSVISKPSLAYSTFVYELSADYRINRVYNASIIYVVFYWFLLEFALSRVICQLSLYSEAIFDIHLNLISGILPLH